MVSGRRGFSGWTGGSLCVGGWSLGEMEVEEVGWAGRWAWVLPLEHSFLPPLLLNCKRGRLSGSACASFCCHYLFGTFGGTLERDFAYIYLFTLCV